MVLLHFGYGICSKTVVIQTVINKPRKTWLLHFYFNKHLCKGGSYMYHLGVNKVQALYLCTSDSFGPLFWVQKSN